MQDEKTREQLDAYLYFRSAEASIRKLDWGGFNSQVNHVSDARLHTYLLLTAARAASDAAKREASSEFLLAALASSPKIEDPEARAAALVTAAGILYPADASWGAQVLAEGVNAINRAGRYDGGPYAVTLEAPKHKLLFPLADSDLGHCFERAARQDWPGSLSAARGIDSKELRSRAYIAVCRALL